MKHPTEMEDEFLGRVEEAKSRGECVFRDDANRETILDIIDNYIDIADSLPKETINDSNSKKFKIRRN